MRVRVSTCWDVDRVLTLIDAGLHAVVADPMPGRGAERVVDRDDGERADAEPARLHQIHLRDLLVERAAGEGDAKDALLEPAVLFVEPVRTAVFPLVVAPDTVIRLVERAFEVGAGVGQGKAFAAPPFVVAPPQHRGPVAPDRLDRHQMLHVEPVRHLEQQTLPVAAAAVRRQRRPDGILPSDFERCRVKGLVVEPGRDLLGIPPFPRRDAVDRAAHQRLELRGERRPVERRRLRFARAFEGVALHKAPLHRIKRCQSVMARRQRPQFGGDAEQRPEEILERQGRDRRREPIRPSVRGRRGRIAPSSAARAAPDRPRRERRQRRDRDAPGRRDRKDRQTQARVSARDRTCPVVRRGGRDKPAAIRGGSVASVTQCPELACRQFRARRSSARCSRRRGRRHWRPRSRCG